MGNDLKESVQKYAEWDYNIKIAGVSFKQKELAMLDSFDWEDVQIRLEQDPRNEVDPNAIKIFGNDVHIGYIPAMVAPHINQLFKDGHQFKCALIYITSGDYGKYRTARIALMEE